MSTTKKNADAVHVFERAGLGRAPFHVVGVEERRGPVYVHTGPLAGFTVGAPGQPMGSCQFCGQGIAEVWTIRSADGRTFEVGCECVRKTGDAGLIVNAAKRAFDAARREKKNEATRAYVRDALASTRLRRKLDAKPHPLAHMAERGYTLLEWVEWMEGHAGASGMSRVAALLKREEQ